MMAWYRSRSLDPAWNLALEEYFFERKDREKTYLLLWQNENTIVIGKNQNTLGEIHPAFVRERGIRVVRRLSGGGAVYHDRGNLNFTFITDAPEGQQIDLRRFCVPIAETLRSFGVEAAIGGRNDITVDGKKFSGNAQYIRRGRVMHHGTLMFDSDLTVLEKALQVDREKLRSKGIASVSSRVTNLRPYLPEGTAMTDFERRLLECLGISEPLEEAVLTDRDLAEIQKIKEERYDTWQWNYGRSPQGTWENSRRIEGCGTVRAALRTEEGRIRDLTLTGDFFGNRAVEELCERLEGCVFQREALEKALAVVNVGQYIHNLTAKALAELLTP